MSKKTTIDLKHWYKKMEDVYIRCTCRMASIDYFSYVEQKMTGGSQRERWIHKNAD